MYTGEEVEEQGMALTRLCKLSELGKCKKWFKPNRPQQDFCCHKHQQEYWKIIRREEKALLNKVMEHDREIKAIKRHLGMKGEK